jgi:hypothetical protein
LYLPRSQSASAAHELIDGQHQLSHEYLQQT